MRKVLVGICVLSCVLSNAQRTEVLLEKGWKFTREDNAQFSEIDVKDCKWESVVVPHDWAISGPFNKDIDKQVVAIEQNGEKEATEKTGRSGSLPWVGNLRAFQFAKRQATRCYFARRAKRGNGTCW